MKTDTTGEVFNFFHEKSMELNIFRTHLPNIKNTYQTKIDIKKYIRCSFLGFISQTICLVKLNYRKTLVRYTGRKDEGKVEAVKFGVREIISDKKIFTAEINYHLQIKLDGWSKAK